MMATPSAGEHRQPGGTEHHHEESSMRSKLIAATAVLATMTAFPALAVDNGIYLGGSVGQSGVDIDDVGFGGGDFSGDATAFKVIAGWRFLDWLSIEGNYVDLGSADERVDGDRFEVDASGLSLSAVGFLPIGPVDLFARVGAINWDADFSFEGVDAGSDDGTDLTYGVGAQFRVWGLSVRAEYEQFDIEDADTVDLISLGVTWTFL
jgi:OOP family OmpA-OmpF porin